MKMTTLSLLFMLFIGASLQAQTTTSGRDQMHREQTTTDVKRLQMQDLDEKRLRLVEAISDADLESAEIMKQEIATAMERQIASGLQWQAQSQQAYPPLEQMKSILDRFSSLSLENLGLEKAREAGNMVSEFTGLMGRAAF